MVAIARVVKRFGFGLVVGSRRRRLGEEGLV